MNKQYHSNGKFLLTGEYLVLKGALALALPLKLGQDLEVEQLETNNEQIQWKAWRSEGRWFSVTLNRDNLVNFSTDDPDKAMRLCQILKAVKQLNPKAFEGNDLKFTTRLDFDPNWGLGSSSTLIANLARWANVNPYELLKLTFGGSGYDLIISWLIWIASFLAMTQSGSLSRPQWLKSSILTRLSPSTCFSSTKAKSKVPQKKSRRSWERLIPLIYKKILRPFRKSAVPCRNAKVWMSSPCSCNATSASSPAASGRNPCKSVSPTSRAF